jgi:hypothetical protein
MTITTKYTTTSTGAGRILAKGNGKQKTLPYDHAFSDKRNHGLAAGELAKALGLTWSDSITHVGFNDGTHKFVFPEDSNA